MRIVTRFRPADARDFARLKRKKWLPWKLLIAGEWSQTPYHQGDHEFHVSSTADRAFWAILSVGFPSRIIAVAAGPGDATLEEVAAAMLRRVADDGGDFIDGVHRVGDVDEDKLLALYWPK